MITIDPQGKSLGWVVSTAGTNVPLPTPLPTPPVFYFFIFFNNRIFSIPDFILGN